MQEAKSCIATKDFRLKMKVHDMIRHESAIHYPPEPAKSRIRKKKIAYTFGCSDFS